MFLRVFAELRATLTLLHASSDPRYYGTKTNIFSERDLRAGRRVERTNILNDTHLITPGNYTDSARFTSIVEVISSVHLGAHVLL